MKLHHVAVLCLDPERLAAFYRQAFALHEVTVHRFEDTTIRSVWLKSDEGVLWMFERAAAPGQGAQGWHLVAFSVSVTERVAAVARLAALGVAEESRSQYSSYFRDLEGNRIAVSHYPDVP